MKVRNGFVSNSSSSSFVITDKNNFDEAKSILKYGLDYYELNDKLYTSSISDCRNEYYSISDLSVKSYGYLEGDLDWIGVEGERGVDTVYVPRTEYFKYIRYDSKMADTVLCEIRQFIEHNNIYGPCDIYEENYMEEKALGFIEYLCGIVGYKEVKNED